MESEGGFMLSGSGSQGGSNGFSSDERVWSVRSLTIKQALDANEPAGDSATFVDGAPLDHVRLVGTISQVSEKKGLLVITIRDITGTMETTFWLSNNEDQKPEFEIGKYVALYGQFRVFNNRRRFTILNVDESIDLQYVLYHEMCALREHLHYTGVKPFGTKGATSGESSANPANVAESHDLFVDSTVTDKVLSILPDQEPGLSCADVANRLGMDELSVQNTLILLEKDSKVWNDTSTTFVAG